MRNCTPPHWVRCAFRKNWDWAQIRTLLHFVVRQFGTQPLPDAEKNYYAQTADFVITINAHLHTIITAHKKAHYNI